MTKESRWELKTLAFLALGYTAYFAKPILFPIFLAVILFFLLAPTVRFLHRYRIPKTVGSATVILIMVGVVSFSISRLINPAANWINSAPQTLQMMEKKLRFLKNPIQKLSDASEKMDELTTLSQTPGPKSNVIVRSSELRDQIFTLTGTAFATLFTTLVLLYFLLIYGEIFLRKIGNFIHLPTNEGGGDHMIECLEKGISRYLVFTTIINFCLGVAVAIAMWLLGVPNPVLWGVLAALLNYIPYVGALIGVAIIFFVSLMSFDSALSASLPPIVYFTLTTIEGQFVTPIFMGGALKLNRLLILLSMIFWGWIWGLEGALLSIPLLSIVKIICDNVTPWAKFSKLLEANK